MADLIQFTRGKDSTIKSYDLEMGEPGFSYDNNKNIYIGQEGTNPNIHIASEAAAIGVPSFADYDQTCSTNRRNFNASGFVEWGLQQPYQPNVNFGITTTHHRWNSKHRNNIILGREQEYVSRPDYNSSTEYPILNVNGSLIRLCGTPNLQSLDSITTHLYIPFPTASKNHQFSQCLNSVAIEVWHELVSEKDIIYPYGNVQFYGSYSGLNAYSPAGTFATVPTYIHKHMYETVNNSNETVYSNVSGRDIYSLFGEWQTPGAYVGQGFTWSLLTPDQKRVFTNDPYNNLYYTKDGIVQVRYRVRVIEKSHKDIFNWKINDLENKNFFFPQGKANSPINNTNDLENPHFHYYTPHNYKYGTWSNGRTPGLLEERSKYETYNISKSLSYNSNIFLIPLLHTLRPNQGAYHPVLNPTGTSKCIYSGNTNNPTPWYLPGTTPYTTTEHCFQYKVGGDYDSKLTGSAGEYYYDIISNDHIIDERISAKTVDVSNIINDSIDYIMNDKFKGKSGVNLILNSMNVYGDGTTSGYFTVMGSATNNEILEQNNFEINIPITCNDFTVENGTTFGSSTNRTEMCYIIGMNTPAYVNEIQTQIPNNNIMQVSFIKELRYVDPTDDNPTPYMVIVPTVDNKIDKTVGADLFNSLFPVGTTFYIIATDETELIAETQLHCDIIGHPNNWKNEYNNLGTDPIGNALLMGRDGESYIPGQINNIITNQSDNLQTNDHFGLSSSLSTDGNTLIVSAPFRHNRIPIPDTTDYNYINYSGEVYTYTWDVDNTAWVMSEQILTVDFGNATYSIAANDKYGWSVSISGDGLTLVVGTPHKTIDSYVNAGVVIVYTRPNTTSNWVFKQSITAPSLNNLTPYFGYSVALNGNGTIMAIGHIYYDSVGYKNDGAAYLYYYDGSTWSYKTTVTAHSSVKQTWSMFGSSVTLSDDGTKLGVGSFGFDYNQPVTTREEYTVIENKKKVTKYRNVTKTVTHIDVGVVSIYTVTNPGATPVVSATPAIIYPPNRTFKYLNFGRFISMRNSNNNILIGVEADSNTGITGYAYLYTYLNSAWTFKQRFTNPKGKPGNLFGYGGSYTNSKIVIGSPLSYKANLHSGEVFLYNYDSTHNIYRIYDSTLNRTYKEITLSKQPTEILGPNIYIKSATTYNPLEQWVLPSNEVGSTKYYGRAVCISRNGLVLVVNATLTHTEHSELGKVYTYDWNNSTKEWVARPFKLYNNEIDRSNDRFGDAICLSSDGSILVVGARDQSDKISYCGKVYIFDWVGTASTGKWVERTTQRLSLVGANMGVRFGHAVSLAYNSTESKYYLAVGTPYEDNKYGDMGSVHIYRLDGSTWVQIQEIQAKDGTTSDLFGYSVSFNTTGSVLAVGAPYDDKNGTNTGTVYTYDRVGNTWVSRNTYLIANDAENSDIFGSAVALNGAGDRLHVGAAYNSNKFTKEGSLYRYSWDNVNKKWVKLGTTLYPNSQSYAMLGRSISVSADNTKVIASLPVMVNSYRYGRVLEYTTSNEWLKYVRSIRPHDIDNNPQFGRSVAMNSAGTVLIVGAPHSDDGGRNQSGVVYTYDWNATTKTWKSRNSHPILFPANRESSDWFGHSVAISDDGNILIVGAPYDDIAYANCGSFYIFEAVGEVGQKVWTQRKYQGGNSDNLWFGMSVAMSSDATKIIVGAPGRDESSTVLNSGGVYLYTLNKTTWALTYNSSITLPTFKGGENWKSHDAFGYSVAMDLDGDYIAIGAPFDEIDGNLTNTGTVYLCKYDWVAKTVLRWYEIANKYRSRDDMFGCSVSLNNGPFDVGANKWTAPTILAVGAPGDDIYKLSNSGQVHLFNINDTGTSLTITERRDKVRASDAKSSDEFGRAICLNGAGNLLTVGSPSADVNGVIDLGKVYFYADYTRVFLNHDGCKHKILTYLEPDDVVKVYYKAKGNIGELTTCGSLTKIVQVGTGYVTFDSNTNTLANSVTGLLLDTIWGYGNETNKHLMFEIDSKYLSDNYVYGNGTFNFGHKDILNTEQLTKITLKDGIKYLPILVHDNYRYYLILIANEIKNNTEQFGDMSKFYVKNTISTFFDNNYESCKSGMIKIPLNMFYSKPSM